jgi:hypothetical protein
MKLQKKMRYLDENEKLTLNSWSVTMMIKFSIQVSQAQSKREKKHYENRYVALGMLKIRVYC